MLFIKTQRLLEDLQDGSYPRWVARLWKQIKRVELLILDDFGFRKYEQREAEILYSLADARLNMASTIITSNRPPEDWYGVFPDPVIGGAVLDRMVAGPSRLLLKGRKPIASVAPMSFQILNENGSCW